MRDNSQEIPVDFNAQDGPRPLSSSEPNPLSETERTVSSERVCEGCGTALIARRPQARFCSDSCRTDRHRHVRSERLTALLTSLQNIVAELKRELGGGQ
jgi:predicted nucleic acid-binding Zn ribbon protein